MKILDCTLRDGGYVNNWEFDISTAIGIMDGLYNAGIRHIEIGILGNGATVGKQTKFNNFDDIKPFLKYRKKDCHYFVMFTQENAGNFVFPKCSEETPDCIRIAFFKKTWKEAFNTAKELKEKGYGVFLQAMATFMYSDEELVEIVKYVNDFKPAAFYMVDSFSTMYPKDVINMRNLVLTYLTEDVAFGFHAHNSMQMAFANVQAFMDCECKNDLFIDCSVYGMGRGAGNVPTELLINYVNNNYNTQYKAKYVLDVFTKYIKIFYEKYGWGYTLQNYLVATQKTNSAYGWYFMNHGVENLSDLFWCLSQIPDDIRFALKRDIADNILRRLHDNG